MSINYTISDIISHSVVEEAKRLWEVGFNVIPIKAGHKAPPLIDWKEYQKARQLITFLEHETWKTSPNIAVICGAVSNLLVVDCDSERAKKVFEETCPEHLDTYKVKTPKGYHFYYRLKDKIDSMKTERIDTIDENGEKIHIDLQGDGAYVIAPPSYRKTEDGVKFYTAINSISQIKSLSLAEYYELRQKLLALNDRKRVATETNPKPASLELLMGEVPETGYLIDLALLRKLILKSYTEGVRHYIALYTAGLLRKNPARINGIAKRLTQGEVKDFIVGIAEETGDTEINDRIQAVETTFRASDFNLIGGYRQLKELIPDIDKAIISTKTAVEGFTQLGGCLYEEKKNGKVEIWEFFEPVAQVVNIASDEEETLGWVWQFADGRKIYVPSRELTPSRLTQYMNQRGKVMGDTEARKVITYFSRYVRQNKEYIYKKGALNRIGWINDNYFLPQTYPQYEFVGIPAGIGAKGDKEKEFSLMVELFNSKTYLALGYIFGLAGILAPYLHIDNFGVYAGGRTGTGKSTVGFLALSLIGDYEKLKGTFDMANTGGEIFLSSLKDTLIVLDESNTANPKQVGDWLVRTIFKFSSGTGRYRGEKDSTLKEVYRFRGVTYFSSEQELSELLKEAKHTVKGAYRRTAIFNFTHLYTQYPDEAFSEHTGLIYNTIKNHYGNLINELIQAIKEDKDQIMRDYQMAVSFFTNEDNGFSFEGQERLFGLLMAILRFYQRRLGDVVSPQAFRFYEAMVEDIATLNHLEFTKSLKNNRHSLLEDLDEWLTARTERNFYIKKGDDIIKRPVGEVFGVLEDGKLFITSLGLKDFARYIQISEKVGANLLVDFGLARKGKDDRILHRTSISINGTIFYVYPITLSRDSE